MSMVYKRAGTGYCLVHMSNIHKSNTGIVGLDGKELVIGDTDYNRERNARTQAVVIQVPLSLGKKPIGEIPDGIPRYGPNRLPDSDMGIIHDAVYARPRNRWQWTSDIAMEVKVGDVIFFPWNQTFDGRNVIAKAKDNSSMVVKISYDTIFAVIREGKIIPIGGHILIDPIWDNFESILRPTYYNFNGPDGKPAVREKSQWVQVKVMERHKEREGIVRHVGTPLKGDRCALKPGMQVIYKPNLKNLIDIDGGKYFVMRQNQILLYKEAGQ